MQPLLSVLRLPTKSGAAGLGGGREGSGVILQVNVKGVVTARRGGGGGGGVTGEYERSGCSEKEWSLIRVLLNRFPTI